MREWPPACSCWSPVTTWGFIGSGNIGSTVAALALAVGHQVVMSNSRGPDSLAALVRRLGSGATAATPEQAAAAGDVVVVTIPFGRYRDVPADALAGTIVIDTMNYYPERDGTIEAVADGLASSALFAESLPGARVVKAFNNIFYAHLAALATPAGGPRSALPVAGDHAEATASVIELLDEIGYDAVNAGSLTESWRQQPDTPVYGVPYAADPADWSAGARRADTNEIRRLLDCAVSTLAP